MHYNNLRWLILLMCLVSACGISTPNPTPQQAYPYPARTTSTPPTTSVTPAGYPGVADITLIPIPLTLDRPLVAGATQVTGSAPPKETITVINISLGDVLGNATAGDDGRFTIPLSAPLLTSELIGITVEQPAETPRRFMCGENCRDFPTIGVIYDYDVVVTPP